MPRPFTRRDGRSGRWRDKPGASRDGRMLFWATQNRTSCGGPPMSQEELKLSISQQEKFEFYLLALIFTILGLAVQTAKFGSHVVADALELCSWAALLISGL